MRLIDADALRNPYSGTSLEWQGVLLLKLLDEAPSIDIVRCKECKWYSDMWGCTEHDEVYLVTNPDDFCSIGERRESK